MTDLSALKITGLLPKADALGAELGRTTLSPEALVVPTAPAGVEWIEDTEDKDRINLYTYHTNRDTAGGYIKIGDVNVGSYEPLKREATMLTMPVATHAYITAHGPGEEDINYSILEQAYRLVVADIYDEGFHVQFSPRLQE